MPRYTIPVTWSMTGKITVTAPNSELAVAAALDSPLPLEADYLEDSFRVDTAGIVTEYPRYVNTSTLTDKQRAVIDNLQEVEGFNDFDPRLVEKLLVENPTLWTDGIYNPNDDDTLYLYPAEGMADKLQILVLKHFHADEVDYTHLRDYKHGYKPGGDYPVIATGGLRVWWD